MLNLRSNMYNHLNNTDLKNNINNFSNMNTPILFNKKSKKRVTKPLTYVVNDTGNSRHFTPAAQEWYNSIYAYNHSYNKSLTVADKNLMSLLKSYFNFHLKQKNIVKKNNNKKTIKQLPIRYRRLSANKIFVGKGDLKHTSNNVVITFYVYNAEGMYFNSKFWALCRALFLPRSKLKEFINTDSKGKIMITYNRLFTLYEFLNWREHYENYLSSMTYYVNRCNFFFNKINTYCDCLTDLVKTNILTNNEKLIMFGNKTTGFKTTDFINYSTYMQIAEKEYINQWVLYWNLLNFNKLKFNVIFMSKLKNLVKNIYNKNVQFNIVSLKKMHLNSDIFTQAISLKLRNRDNKLYRVLKSSLRKVKVGAISKIADRKNKLNKDEFFVNKIRNNTVSAMFTNDEVKDPLNNLLLDYFPSTNNLKINIIKKSFVKRRSGSLQAYVLSCLKHNLLRGIRIEAKGRLTRRFTASRSVFKMKWKGGLKNVYSSFRGLSAIMLRGHVKSNVEYSVINTKNRNGAFGVKGWVSSK